MLTYDEFCKIIEDDEKIKDKDGLKSNVKEMYNFQAFLMTNLQMTAEGIETLIHTRLSDCSTEAMSEIENRSDLDETAIREVINKAGCKALRNIAEEYDYENVDELIESFKVLTGGFFNE